MTKKHVFLWVLFVFHGFRGIPGVGHTSILKIRTGLPPLGRFGSPAQASGPLARPLHSGRLNRSGTAKPLEMAAPERLHRSKWLLRND